MEVGRSWQWGTKGYKASVLRGECILALERAAWWL